MTEKTQKIHFLQKLVINLTEDVENKLKEQLDQYSGEEKIILFLDASGKFLENEVIYQELMGIVGRHGFADEDIEIKPSTDTFSKIMVTLNIA